MEGEKSEPEKTSEQQPPIESSTEQKEEIDIYEKMKSLSEEEKNFCPNKISEFIQALYTRGLIQKMKDIGVKHVPVSLSPSPIPRNLFEKIYFYQIAFNKIYNKLSNDQPFIEKVLEPIASKDNFINKLLEISKKAVNQEKKQKIKLSFFRNDYILDKSQKFLFLKHYITNTNNFEYSFNPRSFCGRVNRIKFKLCRNDCFTCRKFGSNQYGQECETCPENIKYYIDIKTNKKFCIYENLNCPDDYHNYNKDRKSVV